jgi:hypothetical protein
MLSLQSAYSLRFLKHMRKLALQDLTCRHKLVTFVQPEHILRRERQVVLPVLRAIILPVGHLLAQSVQVVNILRSLALPLVQVVLLEHIQIQVLLRAPHVRQEAIHSLDLHRA